MITHPDKVLFPEDGITKGELAAYYEAIAPVMLPHILGRPVTMERYPGRHRREGLLSEGRRRRAFPTGSSAWRCPKKDGTVHHPLVDRHAIAALDGESEHASRCTCGRRARRDLVRPDICVFDLDPLGRRAGRRCARRRSELRDLLSELGLTTLGEDVGFEGLPHRGAARWGGGLRRGLAVRARGGRALVERDPEHLTQEFSKADRRGRIYVDTGRNGYSATFAAPYTVRAKPGAPVSAPCTWDELERGHAGPRTFTLRTMAARVAELGDLWDGMKAQSLRRPMKRLGRKR